MIAPDGWRGDPGLLDVGYRTHLRAGHRKDRFVSGPAYPNGNGFRGFAQSRLRRFHGIPPSTFYLRLKEYALRFNQRDQDLYKSILKNDPEKTSVPVILPQFLLFPLFREESVDPLFLCRRILLPLSFPESPRFFFFSDLHLKFYDRTTDGILEGPDERYPCDRTDS